MAGKAKSIDRQTVGFALLKNQEINIFSKDVGNAAAIFSKKLLVLDPFFAQVPQRRKTKPISSGPIINAPNYRRWLVFFPWSVSLKKENPQISVSGGG